MLKLSKDQLIKDERVVMCFVSPSGDGLKLIFKFTERCTDKGLYSIFYKIFVNDFAVQHHLEQVVDIVTCDVSRACFLSSDLDAYFNPLATTVNLNTFVDQNNSYELFQQFKQIQQQEKEQKLTPTEPKVVDPTDEIMQAIKQTLNPKLSIKKEKTDVYVPHELDYIMESLTQMVTEAGIELYEVLNIQYGKKLRFRLGLKLAEVNLFYGKRGYSVVNSPKSGTNAEFAQVVTQMIEVFIAENT